MFAFWLGQVGNELQHHFCVRFDHGGSSDCIPARRIWKSWRRYRRTRRARNRWSRWIYSVLSGVRFFGRIRIQIFRSENRFCVYLPKSKNGSWIRRIHTVEGFRGSYLNSDTLDSWSGAFLWERIRKMYLWPATLGKCGHNSVRYMKCLSKTAKSPNQDGRPEFWRGRWWEFVVSRVSRRCWIQRTINVHPMITFSAGEAGTAYWENPFPDFSFLWSWRIRVIRD